MKDYKSYTIWNAVTPVAVTSSTDATPIVVTANTHGFSNGDLVLIQGHTTNVAANGIFKVAAVTANTFALQNRYTGASVAGSGAGAGASGLVLPAPKIATMEDFSHAELQIGTSGTATLTVKAIGSLGRASADTDGTDAPNFGATQAPTNPYSFLQMVNLDDNSSVDGATGIVVAGTDINKTYEVNINALRYLTLLVTSWSAGAITAKITLYTI